RWIDLERGGRGRALLEEAGAPEDRLPVLLFPDGTWLAEPDDAEIAERIGLHTEAERPFYDLIVVGGGPAGLAAAVYAASEGLRTLIVEQEAPGGQAGQSAAIENYLGFPEGITGAELARRAVAQAERFGVEILAARKVERIRAGEAYRYVVLDEGDELRCHALLLATGVAWRVLDAPGCPRLVGAGVYYGAAGAEAHAAAGQDVYLLGGGNSAGQAALLLARYARSVTMLVLEDSIEERMSQYLVDRIRRAPNVHVRTGHTVVEAHGEGRLEKITIQEVATGNTETALANALFVFIGAAPQTEWLAGVLERDEDGYVLCGAEMLREDDRPRSWPLGRDPYLLETSVPGVFVAGDVRSGSVKRVASAVGEGSMAVTFVHQYLRDR
ncbi:MAG TPA: FAD-dependent oxidoreductase, partial [Longimicrobiaceae bacterium]|nr:FAD-dependent oxidoreductase [Longimicrobiaceae bacterium]